jgi:hypothetical protein
MQQLQNLQQFTPFLAWKGLFQHLEGLPWMIIMNFVMPMRPTLKNGADIGCQITFPSLKVDWQCQHLPH